MKYTKATRLLLFTAVLSAAAGASTVFNFDNDSQGTSTTFTDTVKGLSATFSSSADPGAFVVYPSGFQTLTGNVLGDPGPAGVNNVALNIAFSQNLNAVDLNFATSDFSTPSPVTLAAYENGSLVGSTTLAGQFLDGTTFPEGELAFSGANFDQLVISSPATDFAVDNITVNTATTPEPSAFALVGVGLFGAGIPAARKLRRGSC